jgi:hypothetical protein
MLYTPRLVEIVMAKGNTLHLCILEAANHVFRFVEFETAADLKTAVEKLDGQVFKGATVHCVSDVRVLYLLLGAVR